jgi:predicted acylesterase/phospholipase RssA
MKLLLVLLLVTSGYCCRILSLSGGGAHGSFQGGVLNKLHDRGKKWDIITGVSVGSLNGMMIGMYSQDNQSEGMKLIHDVWMNITTLNVYRRN